MPGLWISLPQSRTQTDSPGDKKRRDLAGPSRRMVRMDIRNIVIATPGICWRCNPGFNDAVLYTCCSDVASEYIHSRSIRSNNSNVSSLLFVKVPCAPCPASNASSLSGMTHVWEFGRRLAQNIYASLSSPKRDQPVSVRTSTGSNENHSPKAFQKAVSLTSERILYDTMTSGEGFEDVTCSRERSNGARSSGKYTCDELRLTIAISGGAHMSSSHQIAANNMRNPSAV